MNDEPTENTTPGKTDVVVKALTREMRAVLARHMRDDRISFHKVVVAVLTALAVEIESKHPEWLEDE